MNLDGINNLIFDLGNVLLDINPTLSTDAFKKLGVHQIGEFYSLSRQNHLFDNLETGKITNAEFRDEIRLLSDVSLKDEEIDAAWNALLLNMPINRLELLQKLKSKYKVYLLSNTNAIHIAEFDNYLERENTKEAFYNCFDHVYYSHQVGMRKPNADIYEFVLADQSMIAEETMFLDDLQNNLDGAAKLGIQTQLTLRNIVDLFAN
ncbi:MAG: HAD family phosphatase [Flavobacteriales bacterium]|nr:HAD family phosphatase [Flavobacteriales bacterium]